MLLSAVALLVVSASAAEVATDVAAPSAPLFNVFPPAGTTLPENGRLLVRAAERVLITHDDGRVEDVVPGEPSVFDVDGPYAIVTPTLTAGEVISLEAVCVTCGGMEPLTWAVGPVDVDAPVFDGEPLFVEVYARRGTPFGTRIGFDVAFGLPLDEPLVVAIDNEDVAFTRLLADGRQTVSFSSSNPEERELCVAVTVTDVAGNVAEPHAVCIDLVDDNAGVFGCSQTAPSSAVFAVAALLLRRRRVAKGG